MKSKSILNIIENILLSLMALILNAIFVINYQNLMPKKWVFNDLFSLLD